MKFTNQQAEDLAEQILKRFYFRIRKECDGSDVDADFMAAFCAIEAGKDKKTGQISETATRFEIGVFHKLQAVRDGRLKSWSKITKDDLEGATDDALEALATSYGLFQIMGWHVIRDLKCRIADLRDPKQHIAFAVQLLEIVAKTYLKKRDFESVLKIWNTGSPTGKTYDPNYVYNALLVMKKIMTLRNSNPELVIEPAEETESEDTAGQNNEPDKPEDLAALPANTAPVVVNQAVPAKDDTQKETLAAQAQAVSGQIKSWYLSIPTAILTALGAFWERITSGDTTLVYWLAGIAGAIVLLAVSVIIYRKEKADSRAHELAIEQEKTKQQREAQAHELTVLAAKAAMDKDLNNIKFAPQPIQNSDT